MTASLNSLSRNSGPSIYYDVGFRNMLEDHLEWLHEHANTQQVEIEDPQIIKHKGDFYGLLTELSIPAHLQWLILRINGFMDPAEYDGSLKLVTVPSDTTVDRLRLRYLTNRKKEDS